ncbi:hypothetical protein [Arthrobacter sp. M4]|uniref:hypothetical protein n=1 Tax=Arthrobacter sp. M4 TaxID=218160 RepID=UPI001CDD7DB3|nr:hypothetical protein [Arthrobacter sp. M4]MCA4132181.1 hypothetical protein [Arthrobacter sp. M4]
MTSNAGAGQQSDPRRVGVSSATRSLWLRLLFLSTAAAALGLAALSLAAAIVNGPEGLWSAAGGGALVIVFFAISLLIGHFVGRNNPSGAIGIMVATYFVKVVGFAVVLFAIGRPEWLNGRWFVAGAVTAVVIWQTAELLGFRKARLQIYNDPSSTEDGPSAQG